MNSPELNRDISPDGSDKEKILSPQENLETLRELSTQTETSLTGKAGSLATHIESARLSPEQKASYQERASKLLEKYSGRAKQLRDIAVVALVMSAASPSFAQEHDVEHLDLPAAISLTVEQDGDMLEQVNSGNDTITEEVTSVLSLSHTEETAPESELEEQEVSPLEKSDIELTELPDPDTTTSIIMNALEAAAKDQVEYAKQNPIETGAKLGSRFLKGPLKYLGDAIEVGKGIQEGKYKNDTAGDTALKVGKFLLDIKTLGFGSLIVDYLRAQKGQPE